MINKRIRGENASSMAYPPKVSTSQISINHWTKSYNVNINNAHTHTYTYTLICMHARTCVRARAHTHTRSLKLMSWLLLLLFYSWRQVDASEECQRDVYRTCSRQTSDTLAAVTRLLNPALCPPRVTTSTCTSGHVITVAVYLLTLVTIKTEWILLRWCLLLLLLLFFFFTPRPPPPTSYALTFLAQRFQARKLIEKIGVKEFMLSD